MSRQGEFAGRNLASPLRGVVESERGRYRPSRGSGGREGARGDGRTYPRNRATDSRQPSRSGSAGSQQPSLIKARRARRRRPWIFSQPVDVSPAWLVPPPSPWQPPDVGPPPEAPPPEPTASGAADASAPAPQDPPEAPADSGLPEDPADDGPAGAGELVPWLQEALSAELEVLRTVPPTTISWSGPVPIAGYPFAAPTGGGVYIVLDVDKTPLYVGETQDFVIRWRGRLLSAYQLGFTNARGRLPRPLMVYFGRLPVAHARQKSIREAVEHVVIRALINGQLVGPQGLRNARSILTLRVKDQVSIAGLLPTDLLAKKTRPVLGLSGGKLHLRDDSRFETGGR